MQATNTTSHSNTLSTTSANSAFSSHPGVLGYGRVDVDEVQQLRLDQIYGHVHILVALPLCHVLAVLTCVAAVCGCNNL